MDHVVRHVIEHLDIDTKLALKVPPGRLILDRNWIPRHEFTYVRRARALFEFVNGFLIKYKKIKFSGFRSIRGGPWSKSPPGEPILSAFNLGWEKCNVFTDGEHIGVSTAHMITDKKVKFR
jgi:hypothetical protein